MNALASVNKLTESVNSSIQTFQSFAEIALSASERLTALNMEAARTMFAFASAHSAPVFGEGMREQLVGRIGMQGQGLERTAEYVRQVNQVLLKAQTDFTQLGAKQMSEFTDSLHSMLDSLAKTGPAGTADMVAALKSALTAATSTFENMVQTAREVTETNLAAAADALQTTATEAAHAAKSSKKAA